MVCECIHNRLGLGSDDCGDCLDHLDRCRNLGAQELDGFDRDSGDFLYWGELRFAFVSFFANAASLGFEFPLEIRPIGGAGPSKPPRSISDKMKVRGCA